STTNLTCYFCSPWTSRKDFLLEADSARN
uniref:Uncharacterized protein n=1 Tax=Amphimedon queenslandica TaxID=400682 RepID=A0A1X7U2H7_AMPQE